MITSHTVSVSHVLTAQNGDELLVEIDPTGKCTVRYRPAISRVAITIETTDLAGLIGLLSEAVKIINPEATA
jgi:hypothetical protein